MALTMKQKKSLTKEVAKRYLRANKKKKAVMLDEYTATTGYNRSYAARMLRKSMLKDKTRKPAARQRDCIYDEDVLKALTKIWAILDMPCGKRLAAVMPETVEKLESCAEIRVSAPSRKKLITISAATIDRLLLKERRKMRLKGRSWTKPGTLLKHQIPIRTFADWDEGRPGFVEIDLVGHDGGSLRGDFLQTLDVTDVFSGWTETRAVRNKAQKWVFEALLDIIATLPFPVRGIDSDNGSEFINNQLVRFCSEKKITFTRSRPYRKNDNCFVEQKNYSVVRKTVGYMRFDTAEELQVLNDIYDRLRLYTNFFQPSMKLIEKTRIGSKVKKRYDKPRTPYRRLLETPGIDEKIKTKLIAAYNVLNPAELKRQIISLQDKLFNIHINKKTMLRKEETPPDLSSTFSVRQ